MTTPNVPPRPRPQPEFEFQRSPAFWVITVFAVMQIVIGAFVLVGNNKITNTQDDLDQFTSCQAEYNIDFRAAFDAVNGASRETQAALFEFLRRTTTVLDGDATRKDFRLLREAGIQYVRRYRELQTARVRNDYPQPPEDFCDAPEG